MKLVLGQITEAVVAMVTEEVAGLVEEDSEDTRIAWLSSVWLRGIGRFSALGFPCRAGASGGI